VVEHAVQGDSAGRYKGKGFAFQDTGRERFGAMKGARKTTDYPGKQSFFQKERQFSEKAIDTQIFVWIPFIRFCQ
jgi:hypothetical protein